MSIESPAPETPRSGAREWGHLPINNEIKLASHSHRYNQSIGGPRTFEVRINLQGPDMEQLG
jgi:hypothetical protein